jgi:hypothetical protein
MSRLQVDNVLPVPSGPVARCRGLRLGSADRRTGSLTDTVSLISTSNVRTQRPEVTQITGSCTTLRALSVQVP